MIMCALAMVVAAKAKAMKCVSILVLWFVGLIDSYLNLNLNKVRCICIENVSELMWTRCRSFVI